MTPGRRGWIVVGIFVALHVAFLFGVSNERAKYTQVAFETKGDMQ